MIGRIMGYSKIDRMVDRTIMCAVSCGGCVDTGDEKLGVIEKKMIKDVASVIVKWSDDGKGICNICGAGPFSPQGLRTHMERVHRSDLEDILLITIGRYTKNNLENYVKTIFIK